MNSNVILLAGALAMVPAIAAADYCRDCGPDGHIGSQARLHDAAHTAHQYREHKRDKQRRQENRGRYSRVQLGRVIAVDPVYRHYTQVVEHGSCLQRTPVRATTGSWTPAILGAVIGGAVGHRIGDSHGDPGAAALAGSLLGASIGRDVGRHNRDARELVANGPCRSHEHEEYRRAPVEYVVTYRYNGQIYRTHMDHHPGEWVELDVKTKPA